MPQIWANNLSTTLAAGITASATSITLASGAAVPAVPAGGMLTLTITQPNAPESSWEVVSFPGPIAAGATTLTGATRGVEACGGVAASATDVAWPAGSKVEQRLTAAQVNAMNTLTSALATAITQTTLPSTPGVIWNNGGSLSVS